jgi:hypothetical protein
MRIPLPELIRNGDHDALARLVEERWRFVPSPDALRWLQQIALRPQIGAGGPPDSPWSESTWLMWVKNRLDDYAANPGCAEDPAQPYGRAFDVELDPTSAAAWRSFLVRYSRELLADDKLDRWAPVPAEARGSGWMGFAPAEEATIQAAEDQLGRRLPPSLRCFYSVSNGWRATGYKIHDILPVEKIGWLADRKPGLHELALEAESEKGPFKDDPDDVRLHEYRDEQGTRVKRSLVISSKGDNATWLLDPGPEPHDGEWPAGCWAAWNPAMNWSAASFAELMVEELRMLVV